MKATDAKQVTAKVIRDRKDAERKEREHIQTDMNYVYDFIKKCSSEGHFSCGFPLSQISPSSEDELKRNGFKLSVTDSIAGKTLSVNWL